MQFLYGVLGDGPGAETAFARLTAATRESNPGLAWPEERSPGVRLGRLARSFASRHDEEANRALLLDGRILWIDGSDLTGRGTDERGLATLAALYERHGSQIWERIDGSFCLVVRDGHRFHMGVDSAGTRGCYWWAADGILAFHTNLLDLVPSYPGTLHEDLGALGGYLAVGRYLPGETAFREVRHLGSGQALEFAPDGVRVRDHVPMAYDGRWSGRPGDVLADEMAELIAAAVGRAWRDAERPVVPLSGGWDSRYLTAEIIRQAGGPEAVHTITWGEDRARPGGDARVAAAVATLLGVSNTWYEKPQRLDAAGFARALYLTSGETDCATDYPGDPVLHARLAREDGYASLFRGDQSLGQSQRILTGRTVLPASGISRLGYHEAYRPLLDPGLLREMGREQAANLAAFATSLRSSTPTGRVHEARYRTGVRREAAPYNSEKHRELEVYTPLLDRPLMDWFTGVPDGLRTGKGLFKTALARRFPEVAAMPAATRHNLPDWSWRLAHDPDLARFYLEWCSAPGWLDTVDARPRVVEALGRLVAAAEQAPLADAPLRGPSHPRWRERLKATWPGSLARELTLERRAARGVRLDMRIGRIAVLHGLLGRAAARRHAVEAAPPRGMR